MTFGDKWPYIVAEAGTGHLGSITRAKELVHMAKACGADAVKFQLFCAQEPLFCPIEGDEKRHQRWWDTSLTWGEWQVVRQKCNDLKIDFLASVFQDKGIAWLKDLEPVAYKVASRAAKAWPYEETLSGDGDDEPAHHIVSLGMATREEAGLLGWRWNYLHFMQCVSKYPTPVSEARWLTWEDLVDLKRPANNEQTDGLSDHSGAPWPAIDALARGAKIIEVHFGDKEGPDGPVNLTLDELKLICNFRDGLKEMRGG